LKRLYLLLLFLFPLLLFSNDADTLSTIQANEVQYDLHRELSVHTFDTKLLEKYKSQKDFDYTEEKETDNWWTTFKKWLGQLWSKFLRTIFGVSTVSGFWVIIFRILPYLIVIGALFLLGWLFMRVNPKDVLSKTQDLPNVNLDEDEDIINNKDINLLIQQALTQKNYRLAIRYYYLLVLKNLSEKELIVWESQKTNTDYVRELSDGAIKNQLKTITRLYDFIWYGNFEINEKSYRQAEKEFLSINHLI